MLHLAGLIASAPAGPIGHPSFAPSNPITDTTNSFMLFRNSNASNSDPAICHVGKTRTVLIIRLLDDHPINPVSMALTINSARVYIKRAIQVRGDGWLPASNDPFRYDINAGIALAASSAPNAHLTWEVLGNTLRGLQECLVVNEWYDEARFEVFNGDYGHVGDGTLTNSKRRNVAMDKP